MSVTCRAEFIPEDGIAIAQEVARDLVRREPFPQLPSRPFRGWMEGHVEVDMRRRAWANTRNT
jgi:hypothetical protein